MWQAIVVIVAAVLSVFIPTPQEMRNAFTAGQNYFVSRDYVNAIRQYDKILYTESPFLKEDSVKVSILNDEFRVSVRIAAAYQKANTFKQLSKGDSAIHYFRQVANQKEENKLAALAQFQIYDILYKLEKFDPCIQEASLLVRRFPKEKKSEQALYDIGWAYRELENLDSSSIAFERLLSQYPTTEYYARALYQVAQNYFESASYDSALVHWSELVVKFRPSIFTEKDWEKVELKAEKERRIFEATQGREVESTDLELVAKANIKIGDAYRKKGDFSRSIDAYRSIITTYTLLPSLQEIAWIKIADYSLAEKGIDEAIDAYRDAIDANFSNKKLQAKMQYKIAETYQIAKMFTKAAGEFDFYINSFGQVADAIDFSVDKAKFSVLLNYYNAKDFQRAVAHSDSFTQKYAYSDLTPGVLSMQASSLNFLGEYSKAQRTLEILIKQFPKSNEIVNAKVQLGFTLYKIGEIESALNLYKSTLEEHPEKIDSSEVSYYILMAVADLKRYDEALAHFDKVKFNSPYFPAAVNRVTKIYVARSEFDDGEKFLKDVLEKAVANKDSVNYLNDIYFSTADLYIGKSDYQSALNQLNIILDDSKVAVERESFAVQVKYVRGIINFQLENYEAAIEDLEESLASKTFTSIMNANVSNANEKLALSYAKSGKTEKGVSIFLDLVSRTENEIDKGKYYSVLSSIYYESGNYKEGISYSEKSLQVNGLDTATIISSYITLSNCYKGLNQLPKSVSLLLEASEKFPNAAEIENVLFQLAAINYDNSDYEKAIDIFNKFLAQYPESENKRDALLFKGYSHYEIGEWDNAYNTMKRFIAAYPQDPKSPDMQYYASESMFNLKKFESAIREYQNLYKRYPKSELAPVALYNEAWCYYELKQPERMIETFKSLVQKFPKSENAPHGLFTIGDYYYNIKDYPNASLYYTELKNKYPSYEKIAEVENLIYDLSQINSYLEYEKAMKFFDDRKYEKAIEELKKVLTKYSTESIAVGCHVNIASAYEMLDLKREAIEWYNKVIQLYSESRDENERAAVFFAREHKEWLESQ
ncbi:MAG: tetratricopeptide repeat protein [Ignavibacteria bacterium]|nr:tetratricopeptide repeat protein [Ignavibacteria bacterium]